MRWLPQGCLVVGSSFVLLCAGCTEPTTPEPASPLPPPPAAGASAFVWGHVVGGSGVCIDGATVEIIRGPGAGTSMAQVTPCNAWSYGDGFHFDLPDGARVVLRATATGYRPLELEAVASSRQSAITFGLDPE